MRLLKHKYNCVSLDRIYPPSTCSPLSSLGLSQVGIMVKNLLANAGDVRDASSTPGSGRSPGGGNGNLLQYSCLENSHGQRSLMAAVHGVAKSQIRLKQLSTHVPSSLGEEPKPKKPNTSSKQAQKRAGASYPPLAWPSTL